MSWVQGATILYESGILAESEVSPTLASKLVCFAIQLNALEKKNKHNIRKGLNYIVGIDTTHIPSIFDMDFEQEN